MPQRPIRPPPPPPPTGWTPAHTEGLKGLGQGLLQDYQNTMAWLGNVGESTPFQAAGLLAPASLSLLMSRQNLPSFVSQAGKWVQRALPRAGELAAETRVVTDPEEWNKLTADMVQRYGAEMGSSYPRSLGWFDHVNNRIVIKATPDRFAGLSHYGKAKEIARTLAHEIRHVFDLRRMMESFRKAYPSADPQDMKDIARAYYDKQDLAKYAAHKDPSYSAWLEDQAASAADEFEKRKVLDNFLGPQWRRMWREDKPSTLRWAREKYWQEREQEKARP